MTPVRFGARAHILTGFVFQRGVARYNSGRLKNHEASPSRSGQPKFIMGGAFMVEIRAYVVAS